MNWKDIPGFEGLYQVSDCGQVKSLERFIKIRGDMLRIEKEKILKTNLNKYGYEQVLLSKDGVRKSFKVHQLVMYTHSHINENLVINHIDENKRNNHISNLEYCTQAENVRKYNTNNPEKAVEWGKIGGKMGGGSKESIKATKERCGHKYLDTYTGVTYLSKMEVSIMMYETGQAKGKQVWYNILSRGKPQDRFTKIQK
jgi:hypothetical protein